MNGLEMILVLLVGLAIGVALGWMLARSRTAESQARARAAEERASYIEEQLSDRFRALSAQALDDTNQRFLELAEGRLRAVGAETGQDMEQRRQAVERLVEPLQQALTKVEGQLREADAGRKAAHAELAKQVEYVREGSDRLRDQTRSLVTALRRPEARGRWGEMQLRRVAEMAGMSSYCDFEEQASVRTDDGLQRPDMVVRLAGGKNIVVDSKVSLAAYLEAAETDEEDVRADRLRAHARHLRAHVDQLSGKAYWRAFDPAPEFVVLFIPGEAFLAPALEEDPALLEYAMGRRVHIATPTTLVSLLRTAQYAWQQEALSENARAVFELGKQLHTRLATLGGHVDGLGKALSRAVASYNQTVGSLESRVLVTARRFEELGLVDGELEAPRGVEEQARPVASAELTNAAARAAEGGTGGRGSGERGAGTGGIGEGEPEADAGVASGPAAGLDTGAGIDAGAGGNRETATASDPTSGPVDGPTSDPTSSPPSGADAAPHLGEAVGARTPVGVEPATEDGDVPGGHPPDLDRSGPDTAVGMPGIGEEETDNGADGAHTELYGGVFTPPDAENAADTCPEKEQEDTRRVTH